ncbi:hypothetical protein GCM10023166_16950 [Paeniglutamicibacter cryotolerans]
MIRFGGFFTVAPGSGLDCTSWSWAWALGAMKTAAKAIKTAARAMRIARMGYCAVAWLRVWCWFMGYGSFASPPVCVRREMGAFAVV